jgi:hypothetical protein
MDTQSVEEVTVKETPTGVVQTQTVRKSGDASSEFLVSKTNQVIFAIVGIIDLLLLLRIMFLLLGANQVGIVRFIIDLTRIFVAPFTGIFSSPSSGSSYLDVASIVAIVIYLVFGFIVATIVNLFSRKTE